MTLDLKSPSEIEQTLADLFKDGPCELIVVEDRAFIAEHSELSLGTVHLHTLDDEFTSRRAAVQRGAFTWKTPSRDKFIPALAQALKMDLSGSKREAEETKLSRIENSVACLPYRLGLDHPIFDAQSLSGMPFKRATTIVTDTSGVAQGALDFVARFLHPAARIKVPAIVHMEVVNSADRFLKKRRSSESKLKRPELLADHLFSQGTQRALLRLELRADTEVERSGIVGDPLRNAFIPDKEKELADLNLSTPLRAYCDRLIIEAARQHQAQMSPGHPVQVLTSDNGLARMALAEGIEPLYFKAVTASTFYDQNFVGTRFHPFGEGLVFTHLAALLWELATAFGTARLVSEKGTKLTVSAFGQDLAWSPFHSKVDLLWVKQEAATTSPEKRLATTPSPTPAPATNEVRTTSSANEEGRLKVNEKRRSKKPAKAMETSQPRRSPAAAQYRLNLQKFIDLVIELDRYGTLPEARVLEHLGATTKAASEYSRFLQAGDFLEHSGQDWRATDGTHQLAFALRDAHGPSIRHLLSRIPSVEQFLHRLSGSERPASARSLDLQERAATTYLGLGEIMWVGLPIPDEGYYSTFNSPSASGFAPVALQIFEKLDTGYGLVSVGAWLEELARAEGIHPLVARDRLLVASSKGLIRRTTEGSTTDTRHERHIMKFLVPRTMPEIIPVRLYRGDFLIPGKASTSLRLERAEA